MPAKKRDGDTREYHFVSAVCSVEEYNRVILEDKHKTSQAGIKFFRIFLNGFIRNGEKISVFSKRPTTCVKSGKRFLAAKEECDHGINYHYSTGVHIPILGNLYSYLAAFFYFLSPARCKKGDVVFIDPLNVSISSGALAACKLRGIPTVAFITDLPTCYCYAGEKMSAHLKASHRLNQRADGYVNVTRYIDSVINKKGKPSIVLEGFVDEAMSEKRVTPEEKYPYPVCMYTGGLEKIYGLDMLVEGFIKANVENSELHLYGSGSYVDEIKKHAQSCERVKYFGCRENAHVVNEQMKATLLVNPRYSGADYTRYSFPGKNLEYAASGTPTLTTALPGMPEEYYPYVFILEDETVDGMARRLKELLTRPPEELYAFGAATKEWMLENKNSKTQIKKVVDFVNDNFGKR